MRKATKAQNRVVISLVILLVFGAAALIITLVMIPGQKYQQAMELLSWKSCKETTWLQTAKVNGQTPSWRQRNLMRPMLS